MEIDFELLECFVNEAGDGLEEWERICLELNSSNSEENLKAIFRVAHNLKGSSRAIGMASLGDFVHKVEDYIGFLQKTPNAVTDSEGQTLLTVQGFLTEWFSHLLKNPGYVPEFQPLLLSLAERKETLLSNHSVSAAVDAPLSPFSSGIELVTETQSSPKKAQQEAPISDRKQESVRVRSSKLDQLIQVIGELGIQQAIVMHCMKNRQFENLQTQKALSMVTKMTKEIQSQAIGLRMQDIRPLFQRLERTAKDISFDLKKKVQILVDGSDLELDKSVLEIITEPLIHMVRNAVDHGIETPEQRMASGKPEQAKVWIQALSDTDGLRLVIRDDGKGIDTQRVAKKALEKNLIAKTEGLTKKEIYDLLFLPGFSTAESVTAVSGRGVGMEVVKRAIDSVGGHLEVESELGKGTSFAMFLPTSMNIIDAVIVDIGREKYVIPLNHILEIVDQGDNQIDSVNIDSAKESNSNRNETAFKIREDIMPIESLSRHLGLPEKKSIHLTNGEPDKIRQPIVISGKGRSRVAFRVDEVLGQQRIIVKPLSGRAEYPKHISGATVLGDGKPGWIVALRELADFIVTQNDEKRGTA